MNFAGSRRFCVRYRTNVGFRTEVAMHSFRLNVTLPIDAYACIQQLAEQGRFGTSAPDVATFLILSAIKEFMTLNLLPPPKASSSEG